MKRLFLILSILICVAAVYSQSEANDTLYFKDNTIDIGVIIGSYGQSIKLKPQGGNAVTISYDKAMIDSTSNPLYTAEYFAVYRQELMDNSIAENQKKTETKYVDPKIRRAKIITFVGLTTGFISGIALYTSYKNGTLDINITDVNGTMITSAIFITSGVFVNIGILRWIHLSVPTKQSAKKQAYLTFSTKGLGAQMVFHF